MEAEKKKGSFFHFFIFFFIGNEIVLMKQGLNGVMAFMANG